VACGDLCNDSYLLRTICFVFDMEAGFSPFELDRERQRFINGLTKSLANTKFKLAELQASPPAIELPEAISLC
jgi:hypothetical protein